MSTIEKQGNTLIARNSYGDYLSMAYCHEFVYRENDGTPITNGQAYDANALYVDGFGYINIHYGAYLSGKIQH